MNAHPERPSGSQIVGGLASLELVAGERWYVAMTLPRQEHHAFENLANQGFRSFLPRQWVTRRHARQFRKELVSAFPGYLFVILDPTRDRWRCVNGTLGVRHMIDDGERPIAIAPGIVETLVASCDVRGALVFQKNDLAPGDAVRLVGGPFAGTLGILNRLDGAERVQVLVQWLGGAVKVTAPRATVLAAR